MQIEPVQGRIGQEDIESRSNRQDAGTNLEGKA
jgi:hypothetical protein